MAGAGSLHLVVPDLLPALAHPDRPPLPTLGRLLARADRGPAPADDYHRLLYQHFGFTRPDGDVPVGAFARLGEGGEPDEAFWLCATPVHLVAQRDRVVLARAEALTADEVDALAEEINRTFAEDGWHLETRAGRLYLRAPGDCAITTHPVDAAEGRDIRPLLPAGPDRLPMHRFLTELQMLLHQSPVNEARESAGKIAITGLWLWGAGRLPTRSAQAPGLTVYSDDPFGIGLSRYTGNVAQPLPHGPEAIAEGEGLVVLPIPRDAVVPALAGLEANWIGPAVAGLRRGRWDRLVLYPGCGQRFELRRRHWWRFWRRGSAAALAEAACR